MTLAGTRPPTVDEWEKYELHHRARLAIKPGLTGMWQVSGRSDITDFEEVVKREPIALKVQDHLIQKRYFIQKYFRKNRCSSTDSNDRKYEWSKNRRPCRQCPASELE